jgi:hypothetical protein
MYGFYGNQHLNCIVQAVVLSKYDINNVILIFCKYAVLVSEGIEIHENPKNQSFALFACGILFVA